MGLARQLSALRAAIKELGRFPATRRRLVSGGWPMDHRDEVSLLLNSPPRRRLRVTLFTMFVPMPWCPSTAAR